jgi:hypothetical protein
MKALQSLALKIATLFTCSMDRTPEAISGVLSFARNR